MQTKHIVLNRAMILLFLVGLTITDIIKDYILADTMDKIYIIIGYSLFMMILSVFLERYTVNHTIKHYSNYKWINESHALKRSRNVIQSFTILGLIMGLIGIMIHNYVLLGISSFMIININITAMHNAKILLNNEYLIIDGYTMKLSKIKSIHIESAEKLQMKIDINNKHLGFKFKKDETNVKALNALRDIIESTVNMKELA